jgi:hypothetical protein
LSGSLDFLVGFVVGERVLQNIFNEGLTEEHVVSFLVGGDRRVSMGCASDRGLDFVDDSSLFEGCHADSVDIDRNFEGIILIVVRVGLKDLTEMLFYSIFFHS